MATIDPELIDVTKPTQGEALTAEVRANEQATKTNFERAVTDIDGKEDLGVASTLVNNHDMSAAAHGGVQAAYFAHAGSGATAHAAATPTVNGFMSSADKSKLDGIPANAEANTVDSVFGRQGTVVGAAGDYDSLYGKVSSENTTPGALQLAVVASLPGTPDANTIYFVTT